MTDQVTNQVGLEDRISTEKEEVKKDLNKKLSLFDWLREYYCKNFENHKEVLIISNGTLIEKLIEKGLIQSEGYSTKIETKEDLFAYLDKQADSVGIYLLDKSSKKIMQIPQIEFNRLVMTVKEFNNANTALSEDRIKQVLPGDFFRYKPQKNPLEYSPNEPISVQEIDLTTRLAVQLPKSKYEGIETFQIRRKAYTPLGFGKVTHFNSNGLSEEFFFKQYEPTDSTLIGKPNEGEKAVGILRLYMKIGNTLYKVYDRPQEFIK